MCSVDEGLMDSEASELVRDLAQRSEIGIWWRRLEKRIRLDVERCEDGGEQTGLSRHKMHERELKITVL